MKVRAICRDYPDNRLLWGARFAITGNSIDFRELVGEVVLTRQREGGNRFEMEAFVAYDHQFADASGRTFYTIWWPWWALKPENAE